MRQTRMSVGLCVLVVFVTSVCQGAAAPSQRFIVTDDRNNDCIEYECKRGSTLQNFSAEPCTGKQFSERRKRQVEVVQQNETQPVDNSTQPTSTEAQFQVEDLNSTVLVSSSATASSSQVVLSLPPPPHPSAAQATAVKPRSCKSGSTWEEECNTCWCLDNGMAACTVKRCEVVSPVAAAKTEATATLSTPTTSVQSSTTSVQSQTTSVPSPTTSVQTAPTSVQSSTTSVQSSTTSVPSPTTSVQTPPTSVQSSTTLVQSQTTSVPSLTTSVQTPTTSVQTPPTSVQTPTTSVQSPTTGQESSVVPRSPTTPVQSTSSSGGTS